MSNPEVPSDLILPEPETQKELDLFRTLQDNANQVNSALTAVADTTDKVKASSSGTAGYLDAIVDDDTVEISSNTLQVKGKGVDTPEINDSAVDTLQLAADAVDGTKIEDDAVDSEHIAAGAIDTEHIGANQVTTVELEDDLVFGTFPLTPSAAPDADYEVANKKYVDDEVAGISDTNTSNVIFAWSGIETASGNDYGVYMGTTMLPANLNGICEQLLLGNDTGTARTLLMFQFTKISGISTVTIHGRIFRSSSGTGTLTVDIGGQSNTVTTTSTSPAWVTTSDIDVSGLSDGTYDGVIKLHNTTNGNTVACSAVTLIAS